MTTDNLRIAPDFRDIEDAGDAEGRRRDRGEVSAGPPCPVGLNDDPDSLPLRPGLRNAAAEIIRGAPPGAPDVSEDVDFVMRGDENGGSGRECSGGNLWETEADDCILDREDGGSRGDVERDELLFEAVMIGKGRDSPGSAPI